jgi:signal transduction histidine kinase
MGQAAKRWGSFWMIVFGGLVLVALISNGAPRSQIYLQAAPLVMALPLLVRSVRRPDIAGYEHGLLIGMLLYLATVVNTGGCASPFVIVGVPMLFGAVLLPIQPAVRWLIIGAFSIGFVTMSLQFSHPGTVFPVDAMSVFQWSPSTYVLVSAAVVMFVAAKVNHIGRNVSRLYERVAFELTTSREELCNESEDRTRALEGIAARLAHEVKNPLAAIKGLSTHMARSATDPKMAERLAIVAAEADRLKEIVDGFLSFSRGLDEMHVVAMHPFEVARELTLLLEVRAGEAGVALEVTGPSDLTINADRRQLRQALLNLVLNAIQASPSGQTVRVEVGRECAGASIRVIDRGSGMSPEVLERIRRPYFTTREGGSGLGIAVARGLVEQHGGGLKYESAPGNGTTVTIHLPQCAMRMAMERRLPDPTRREPAFLASPEGRPV